ncbi:multicopper oxidase domain-containing protein [Bacillus sp. FJAT-29814]|uniref:multicopper oxidase domain-containing protein n=1 Tax=Bacillus sp. FJAT-29814 TaxID=1729688 RepID=UPI000831738B|nr:multicopper oxidase domain-containing protein [Bacillus sp. FJAT-29814]
MKKWTKVSVAVLLSFLLILQASGQTMNANASVEKKPSTQTQDQKKKQITNADRKAAAQRLDKKLSKVGLNQQSLTGELTPGITPDYFGTIPNYANSPLPAGSPIVTLEGGGGTGARADAKVTIDPDTGTGAVTEIPVISGGSGYTEPPTVSIWGRYGSGAKAEAEITDGVVTKIIVTNGGNGYSVGPVVTFEGGSGTGAEATATVTKDPDSGNSSITQITITNEGSGYTSPPTVFITGGNGSGAEATAEVANGVITKITVTSGGSGYTVTGGIRKFVDSLPLLGTDNANNLGQYMPVAIPDSKTFPGNDYYEIELGEYTEQLHSDLPKTTLRGYRQTNTNDSTVSKFSFLGPVIIAQKGRPVRIKFTNKLPTGSKGDLFLPVDTTVMGAGEGPLGKNVPAGNQVNYTQNRATLHLHGGNTPWISDGTQHQWITPAGEKTPYPKGVSVKNVPDMPDPGDGSQTFYYSNEQASRLMFYHDHSYGITRLNVYAGEAAGYLLRDDAEQALIDAGVIPSDEIPLMIQDKSFVPNDHQLAATDPTWDKAKWGGKGNLWFPHVYMPNQNPYDIEGANAMGRWDYGPWFWPPFTGIQNGPVKNPYYDPVNAPWEPPMIPGVPNLSVVPESFMDTPIVNGTAYPYLEVGQKDYRFRILNASNDRFLNLQLYYAKSDGTMWNLDGTLRDPDAGEVKMVPAVPKSGLPSTYPTDGRDGGVPDPAAAGPSMIQIGTESGFLPNPAVLRNTPVGYDYDRRSMTVLNVTNKTLFLGPAERADVIVDFSKIPDGAKLILYNDSPAPVPAFDTRYDYYTGDPDQTDTGGSPSTLPGYGPNTRTIIQFQVNSAKGTGPSVDLAALQKQLPAAYAKYNKKPIVPQASYNNAFGTNYPADGYARIFDTSMTFFNGPLTNIKLTNGGSGFTTEPTVEITGGGGTGATAKAALAPRAVGGFTLTSGGSGYTSVPTVTLTGGGGTGAKAQASLTATSLASITVTNGGSKYSSAPTVTITGGGGSGATATATVKGNRVTAITITNPGTGYTSLPTVSFSGGGGSGATAAAVLKPTAIGSINLTSGGDGYTSPPTVTISGGSGTAAAATAELAPGAIASITLVNGGDGYGSAPTVKISGGGGSGATAEAIGLTMDLQPKSIIEDFDVNYGRMNAMMGVEVPHTSANIQTSIPYTDIDPPTELFKNTDSAAPLGTLKDGTQIWKITHNGVDTHAIHWHMFDVQLINRVGWDGMIKAPDPNEFGWKDTIRMNPLEDVIIAVRPIIPNVPFELPNSVRPLDPTMPLGSTMGFMNVDPTNQPARVTNQMVNFGWEYVWHCHLLGHEENIMMRPMGVAVVPKAPINLAGTYGKTGVNLTWRDQSINETGFLIERSSSPTGPWTTIGTAAVDTKVFLDTTVSKKRTYYYRVTAINTVGYTQTYAAPTNGYPTITEKSSPSDTISVSTN